MMTSGMRQKQMVIYNETLALFNEISANPWLAEGMRAYGHDDDSWTYGESLASTAYDLARARVVAEATQLGATDAFYRLFDRAWPHFQWAMQTSVDVFQGQTEYLELLGLHEARLNGTGTSQITKPGKHDNAGEILTWLDTFYQVALNDPNIAAILTENNVSLQRLAKDAALLQELQRANRHKEQAIAAKKQAVSDRNEAFERLRPWLRRAQRTVRTVKKEHAAQKTRSVSLEL